MTIWSLLEHNPSPFNYETPLFGPPWRVPFEFPIFQITAAGLVVLGVPSIDQAARIANILYFYLSASFLYFISRRLLNSSAVAACIVLVYVWSPFNVYWSRTCMIDFASVSFALAYLYYFETWLNEGRAQVDWRLGTAIFMGCLGYLCKATTMPAILLPMAYLSFRSLFPSFPPQSVGGAIRELWQARKGILLKIVVAVCLPAFCGYGWTAYANSIKAASPYTEQLVISKMGRWVHGEWGQPLTFEGWAEIFSRLGTEVFPYFTALLVPVGLLAAYRHSSTFVAFVYTTLLGAALTVIIFFHLYQVHDYYLMAITANLCVVAGVGAHYIATVLVRERGWLAALSIPILLVSYNSGLIGMEQKVQEIRNQYSYVHEIAETLKGATDPSEYVVVKDFDWNSAILYYARRRGFMVWPPNIEAKKAYRFFKENNFTAVVYKEDPGLLMSGWRHHAEIAKVGEWRISRVSDEEPYADALQTKAQGETLAVVDSIYTVHPVTAGNAIKIPLESPEFRVSGWAVDAPAQNVAGGVYLDIDGKLYQATFPLERRDVGDYFKNPAYVLSGFTGHFSTSELGKGRHTLSVLVLTNDGAAHYAPAAKFVLEID